MLRTTRSHTRLLAGCAAVLGIAATGFAAPPPEPDSGGTDLDQILENAEERAEDLRESDDPATARETTDAAPPAADPAERPLPHDFDRLELTETEQQAMLRVIGQYDRQIDQLLDRFADLHREAISVEGIALAGTMGHEGESALAGGGSKEGVQERTAGFRPGDASTGDKPAKEIKKIGEASPLADPAAESWKRLHELHLEAVKVEAQKLAAVEKLLSPEQLERLHGFRSQAPSSPDAEDRPDRPDLQNQDADEERRDREADRAAGAGGVEAGSSEPQPQGRGPGEG